MTNTFLSRLDWRFATKQFDATKKLSEETLSEIKRAIRFAPTSFGIQPFHVIHVRDVAMRTKLRTASFDQTQVTDASDLFVFVARNDVSDRIDGYVDVASGGDGAAKEALSGFGKYLHGALDARTGTDVGMSWAARQAYIGLGFGLAASAELGVDTCPMEGFDADAVDAILELPKHMHVLAYVALGYRSTEPERPKVRFPESDIFEVR
jgi:nitroreductase/dihydropteridine reductase